jgi:hypothetical protein
MDRPYRLRPFVVLGLGLLLAAAGCRSTRNEVPPGRPFAKDGQQRKAIEFSNDPHPMNASAGPAAMPNGLGGSNMASGIGSSGGRPDGASYGGPPGAYGAPGTAGMPQPGTTDPSTSRASGGSLGTAPEALPPMEANPGPLPSPSAGPEAAPSRDVLPMPSQNVLPAMDKPGSMAPPDQPPSPN